jgi:TolB-like protein
MIWISDKFSLKIFLKVSIILNLLLLLPLFSQTMLSIAVYDFEAKGIDLVTASGLTDLFRNDLVNTDRFIVVERVKIEKIIEELALQNSGCTSVECAARIGHLLNVQKMIIGTFNKIGNRIYILMRLVDVESGKIDFSEEVFCNCPVEELRPSVTDLVNKFVKRVEETEKLSQKKVKDISVTEGNGLIYINTKIGSAAVYLDGEFKGNTPQTMLNIATGQHYVRVLWSDGRSWEELVNLIPGESYRQDVEPEKQSQLNQVGAQLTICSVPEEGEVFIDGVQIGVTPTIRNNVIPGKRKIVITRGDQFSYTEIQIEEYKKYTIRDTLKNILIQSEPTEAEVYINKLYQGKTPLVNLNINDLTGNLIDPGGKNEILLIKDDFYHVGDIEFNKSKNDNFSFRLDHKLSKLLITTSPGQAEVYINKQYAGKTPLPGISKGILVSGTKIKNEILVIKDDLYYSGLIDLKDLERNEISLKLEKKISDIIINSNLLKANVYIFGANHGKTPLIGLNKSHFVNGRVNLFGPNEVLLMKDNLYHAAIIDFKNMENRISEFQLDNDISRISIKSIPPGAEIYLNDYYMDQTPMKKLKPEDLIQKRYNLFGTNHLILIKDQAYYAGSFNPELGKYYDQTFTLSNILINSYPIGADVYINGYYQGETPLDNIKKENILSGTIKVSGLNNILLVKDDLFIAGLIDFQNFENQTFSFNLQNRLSEIVINTNPVDADIYINGRYQGKSALKGLNLDDIQKGKVNLGSENEILLIKDNLYYAGSLDFAKIQNNILWYNLKKTLTDIIINSNPQSFDVTINQKYVGKTPIRGLDRQDAVEGKISLYKKNYLTLEKNNLAFISEIDFTQKSNFMFDINNYGRIDFQIKPKDAMIKINNKWNMKIPDRLYLPVGKYELFIWPTDKANFVPLKKNVEIKSSGEIIPIDHQF